MQEEKYGSRDRSYSAWHRRASTRRFVGIELAQTLAMIDLDASLWVEYDDGTKEPLMLIETARDVGQNHKSATVTTNLAKMCSDRRPLPAYAVLYKLADTPNPADGDWKDIESFRVKRLWPQPEHAWTTVSPQQWAEMLVDFRKRLTRYLDTSHDTGSSHADGDA